MALLSFIIFIAIFVITLLHHYYFYSVEMYFNVHVQIFTVFTQCAQRFRVLYLPERSAVVTPSPIHRDLGDGVLFSIDFFVYIFLCFFVSKITRKRLDRFA